jgi:hypothetical protein
VYGWLEGTIQPACEAGEESLAPGDGEAEPGEPIPRPPQPTKWATDEAAQNRLDYLDHDLSPASQALGN